MRRWIGMAICLVGISASLSSQLHLVNAEFITKREPRDPFVDPRTIPSQTAVKPKLVGVLADATTPLAVIGEDVVTVGDTIYGWRLLEVRHDSIAVSREGRGLTINVGDILPIGDVPVDFLSSEESLIVEGDEVNGWKVLRAEPDVIVVQRGHQIKTLHPGDLLPSN